MSETINASSARTVVANISLSLDGRINGSGGDHDMSWIVPHAVSDAARDHMIRVTSPATTVLLGRKNYEGFSQYWTPLPALARYPGISVAWRVEWAPMRAIPHVCRQTCGSARFEGLVIVGYADEVAIAVYNQ